jgi:hypothetical protein
VGLITRAQLTFGGFGATGTTYGRNGQGKLAHRNNSLWLGPACTVMLVSFTSVKNIKFNQII